MDKTVVELFDHAVKDLEKLSEYACVDELAHEAFVGLIGKIKSELEKAQSREFRVLLEESLERYAGAWTELAGKDGE